jgi:hypothetical protein
MIQHGRTPFEVLIGGKIAEQIGWSDPRLSGLRDEVDALQWQLSDGWKPLAAEPDPLGCDSLRQLRHMMGDMARLGQSEWLRRELVASGLTVAQAAELRRSRLLQAAATTTKPDTR